MVLNKIRKLLLDFFSISMPITVSGNEVSEITVNNQQVKEVTVNGNVVFQLAEELPQGAIVMYNGAFSDLSSSWTLCDGNNAPDLNGKFLKSIPDSSTSPGNTGGQSSVGISSHDHSGTAEIGGGYYSAEDTGTDAVAGTSNEGYASESGSISTEPPYVELAYIKATETTNVEPGVIVAWSGSSTDVPSGWAICDGNNGTPDLRNNFVKGTTSESSILNTGGSYTKSWYHSHKLDDGTDIKTGGDADATENYTNGERVYFSWLPPYYELIFIQKQ